MEVVTIVTELKKLVINYDLHEDYKATMSNKNLFIQWKIFSKIADKNKVNKIKLFTTSAKNEYDFAPLKTEDYRNEAVKPKSFRHKTLKRVQINFVPKKMHIRKVFFILLGTARKHYH